MPRPEKVQAVEDIKQRLDAAPAVFLTEYRGLSVPQQEALRAGLREAGAEYKVVKMTEPLRRIVMEDGSSIEIADVAKSQGFDSLARSGLKKAMQGVTSLAEVNRVTLGH